MGEPLSSMNLSRSLVPLCSALLFVLACGEAAKPPQSASNPRSELASGPATVVSVPEPSPEVVETEQQASDDEERPANSATPRLAGYAGEFRGELMSTDQMVPAITYLRWKDDALTGEYSFGHQLDKRGTLHDCSEPEPNIVRCEWRDEYGTGALELSFSSDTSNFEGEWAPEAEPELLHPWTGVRIGEVEQGSDDVGPDGR